MFLFSSTSKLFVSVFHLPINIPLAKHLCSFGGNRKSILDSIVVSSMPEHERTNFGRVRLWGELGNGVASSIMMTLANSENYGFEVSQRCHFYTVESSLLSNPNISNLVSIYSLCTQ